MLHSVCKKQTTRVIWNDTLKLVTILFCMEIKSIFCHIWLIKYFFKIKSRYCQIGVWFTWMFIDRFSAYFGKNWKRVIWLKIWKMKRFLLNYLLNCNGNFYVVAKKKIIKEFFSRAFRVKQYFLTGIIAQFRVARSYKINFCFNTWSKFSETKNPKIYENESKSPQNCDVKFENFFCFRGKLIT